jgi:hypothetical protein
MLPSAHGLFRLMANETMQRRKQRHPPSITLGTYSLDSARHARNRAWITAYTRKNAKTEMNSLFPEKTNNRERKRPPLGIGAARAANPALYELFSGYASAPKLP